MKRFVSLLLVLVMLGVFSVAFATGEEPVKLVMITQSTAVEQYCNYFNSQNPDIQIEFQYVSGGWQELSQKIVTLIAADMAPDITFMSPTYLADFAMRGMLLDLTEYVERDVTNMDDYVEGIWESMSVDGRIYGVPKDVRFSMMWFNKRMFNELGLDYPCQDWSTGWSVEEWVETMKKVSGHTVDETNVTRGMNPDWRYCRMMNLFQWEGITNALDAEGNADYNNAAVVKAYQTIMDGVKEGWIATAGDKDAIGAGARFYNGHDSFTLTGNWTYDSNVDNVNLGVAVMPGGVSNYWNDMYCGLASTKHPEEVWEVMKFFNSYEYWDWAMSDPTANGIAFSPFKSVNEKYADALYPTITGADRECLFGYLENATAYVPFPCYTEFENMLAEHTSLMYALEVDDVQAELDTLNEDFQDVLDEFYEEYGR